MTEKIEVEYSGDPQFVPGSLKNGIFKSEIGSIEVDTKTNINADVALLTTQMDNKTVVIYDRERIEGETGGIPK